MFAAALSSLAATCHGPGTRVRWRLPDRFAFIEERTELRARGREDLIGSRPPGRHSGGFTVSG